MPHFQSRRWLIGVIGRSGAGKSTLLRTIKSLAPPAEAESFIMASMSPPAGPGAAGQWRARSAMIFQQFNLVGRLDVLTNVLMGRLSEIPSWRSLAQLWPEEDLAIAMSALEQFDMDPTCGAARRSAFRRPAAARGDCPRDGCRSPTSFSPTSRSPRSIPATPRS